MSQPAKTLEPATAELLKRPQSLGARLVQKRQEMKLSTKLQKEFYRRLTVSTNKNTNFTLDELLVLSEGLLDVKEIDGIDLICKYEFEKRQEMIDKHSRPKPTRPDSAQRLKEVKERIEQKAKQDVIKHLERKSRNKYVVVPKHLEILQELDPINVQCRGESVPIINTSLKVHEMSFDTYKKNRNYLLNSVALSSNPTLAKKWIDRKFPSLAEMQSRPLDYIDPKIFDEKYNFLKEMLQDSGTNNYSALEGVKAKEILKLLTEGKRENLRSAGAETVEGKEKQNLDSASETVDWGELVKKIRRDQKNSKKEEQLLFVEEIKNEQKQIEDPNFKVILGPRTYSGKSGTKPPQNPSKMIKEAVNRLRKSIIEPLTTGRPL